MPNGPLHRELTKAAGIGTDGREVQRLMDSTSKIHGSHHREDHVHSIPGVAVELARAGKLNGKNLMAAGLHLAQDAMFDRMWKALPVKGPARELVKKELQVAMTRTLREANRRR